MNDNAPTKANAEQYARTVLWHLCTIQASLQTMQSDAIYRSGQQADASDVEILKETAKRGEQIRKLAEPLYRDALEQANLKQSPTFPH